jgi:type IV fimbrial biogenesis protein FimT
MRDQGKQSDHLTIIFRITDVIRARSRQNNPFICQRSPLILKSRNASPQCRILSVAGFTIIELMVVIVIIAILAGVGYPAMRAFLLDGRIRSMTEDFTATVNMARIEASRLRDSVTVCASTNQSTCNGADWSRGWVVRTSSGTVVRKSAELSSGAASLYADVAITAINASATSLTFRADGTISGSTQKYLICDGVRKGETGRLVEVTELGRVSVGNSVTQWDTSTPCS